MSTRSKGRKNELRAKRKLEEDGYSVQIAPNPTRYSKQNDLFGLWDLIAVNQHVIRFIQVKSNRKVYGKEKLKYQLFECPMDCSKEIWVYYDRKGFEIDFL